MKLFDQMHTAFARFENKGRVYVGSYCPEYTMYLRLVARGYLCSAVNRLRLTGNINRYEVFCRFTGFKWLPPSQLCACANCMTTCTMDASESRSYIVSPTSRVSVVWKHFGLETDDSAQRKPHNLYTMQAEGCPWRRHNQSVEEPSSHEASLDVRMMSSLRVTRGSSFETFLRSAEVKEVPPHSTRAVQQQLTG